MTDIITASLLFVYPLSLLGAWFLMSEFVIPKFKTRKGFIRVVRMTANGHMKHTWGLPMYEATEMDEGGEWKESETPATTGLLLKLKDEMLQFCDNPDMTFIYKNCKAAMYDVVGNQISIPQMKKYGSIVPGKTLDDMATFTYNLGKISAIKSEKKTEMLMILALAASAGAALGVFVLFGQLDQMAQQMNSMQNVLSTVHGIVNGLGP